MKPFVFVDRDGTLIEDTGYPSRRGEYRLLPGVAEGLRQLRSKGYRIAIVTNQSGIGRGYFAEADFHAFQQILIDDLLEQGVSVEGTLFCPHTPDDRCNCRKPATGLLDRARIELGADIEASWVIGDTLSDMQLAENAACTGAVLVSTGQTAPEGNSLPGTTRLADCFEDAARQIPEIPSRAAS